MTLKQILTQLEIEIKTNKSPGIQYPKFSENGNFFCSSHRRKRSTHSTNREDQPPDGVCETGEKKTKLSDWLLPSQVMSCLAREVRNF